MARPPSEQAVGLLRSWRQYTRIVALAGAMTAGFVASFTPVLAHAAASDPAAPVLGRWLTRDADGVFEIGHCGPVLCGRLVGMRYNGAMPTDTQHHPQCGLTLLEGFTPTDEAGHWHGTIRDPDNDHRYQATIWSPRPGILKLHGYLLIPLLGQTQQWTRYDGPIGEACRLPPR